MKDELMNVKIKFTEQSQTVAELKQEISRLETKVSFWFFIHQNFFNFQIFKNFLKKIQFF
jgi:hypothetical protein